MITRFFKRSAKKPVAKKKAVTKAKKAPTRATKTKSKTKERKMGPIKKILTAEGWRRLMRKKSGAKK